MGARFEQEMCQRVREWMKLAEEKLVPQNITLYFMAGNDDLYSIDKVVDEFKHIRNPDMKHFEMDGGYEVVGLSNANMTPWLCARDVEEAGTDQEIGRDRGDDPKAGADHCGHSCSAIQFRPGHLS